jgi:hypothetical protein
MTGYSLIDPILTAWARQKGVHVLTEYKEYEVRGVMIYGPSDETGHLWLTVEQHGMVGVHAAASDGFKADRLVPLSELANELTEAYDEVYQHVPSWEGRNPYEKS